MTDIKSIPDDIRKSIEKEIFDRLSKVFITAIIGVLTLAAIGGWYLLLPWLKKEIGAVPESAVIAIDESDGCPDGWTDFADAAGRMIIGEGNGNVDKNNKKLNMRQFRVPGGEEAVTLEIKEMPAHDHGTTRALVNGSLKWHFDAPRREKIPVKYDSKDEPSKYDWSQGGGEDGKTVAHNNMPPFIALYYCKQG